MAATVVIEGLHELLAQLDGLKTDGVAGDIADAVEVAARAVRDTIREEAPQGPTGNLKRSLEYGVYKKRQGEPIAGFAQVNHKIAPHSHWVEFGARGGDMPRNPFFRRGWNKSKGAAEKIVTDGISAAIDKAL